MTNAPLSSDRRLATGFPLGCSSEFRAHAQANSNGLARVGGLSMNTSLVAADPVTHLKVVTVALLAGMLVILVGFFANGSALEKPGLRTVVKASTLSVHANSGASTVR
jgi:hypothetical protein